MNKTYFILGGKSIFSQNKDSDELLEVVSNDLLTNVMKKALNYYNTTSVYGMKEYDWVHIYDSNLKKVVWDAYTEETLKKFMTSEEILNHNIKKVTNKCNSITLSDDSKSNRKWLFE